MKLAGKSAHPPSRAALRPLFLCPHSVTGWAFFLLLTTAISSGPGLSLTGSPEGKGSPLILSSILMEERSVLMSLWSSISCCPEKLPFETHTQYVRLCITQLAVDIVPQDWSLVCSGFCSVRVEPWATHLLGKGSTSKLHPKLIFFLVFLCFFSLCRLGWTGIQSISTALVSQVLRLWAYTIRPGFGPRFWK